MKIPDELRKSVGFIAFENKTNKDVVPVGSFFFLGHDPKPGEKHSSKVYAVTAKHVIDGLKRRGAEELILRLNPKDPDAPLIEERVALTEWFSHPTDNTIDVSVLEKGIKPEADHLVLPFAICATRQFLTFLQIVMFFGSRRDFYLYPPNSFRNLNSTKAT